MEAKIDALDALRRHATHRPLNELCAVDASLERSRARARAIVLAERSVCAHHLANRPVGGQGGGGSGSVFNATSSTAGTVNTGGGGGAGVSAQTTGQAGGSGVVIIRYSGGQQGTGGIVTSSGGYTYHAFTSSANFTA